jgi:hypothetical protein
MKSLLDAPDLRAARSPLYDAYREAEDRYGRTQIDEALGRRFSFTNNRVEPVHSWYMFKEGFAADLVGQFIGEFPPGDWLVVDPFSGSGTTVLHAQLRGLRARGVEVNSFFVDVASTKLRWNEADLADLKERITRIVSRGRADTPLTGFPELTSFRRLYSEDVLAELFRLKSLITEETGEAEFTRKFLLLGLTSVLELTSRAYKTGKGLKFRKRQSIESAAQVLERVQSNWGHMLDDVGKLREEGKGGGDAQVQQGDARSLPLDDNSAQLIIYSPPYANTFDYNEVYKLEMWFLDHVKSYEQWRQVKEAALRSHVSLRIGVQSEGNELLEQALRLITAPAHGEVQMLRAYFADMTEALREQYRIARKGAHVVIVVGNSSYRCVPVATDLILARIAESIGFTVESIRVGRRLNTSSQQMATYNATDPDGLRFVRESAVILRR